MVVHVSTTYYWYISKGLVETGMSALSDVPIPLVVDHGTKVSNTSGGRLGSCSIIWESQFTVESWSHDFIFEPYSDHDVFDTLYKK